MLNVEDYVSKNLITIEKTPAPYASWYQHQDLILQLGYLGQKLGLKTKTEYFINLESDRNGRIDIVWMKDNLIFAAFEVDKTTPKPKSIKKLSKANARYSFCILRETYGRKENIVNKAKKAGIKIVDLGWQTVYNRFMKESLRRKYDRERNQIVNLHDRLGFSFKEIGDLSEPKVSGQAVYKRYKKQTTR